MRYEEIKDWKDTDFKQLTGVSHETFEKMLVVLDRELPSFGRPPRLSRADQLLLMYWREYRTQFHIAGSYGLSEATVCRTINKVEDALVRSGEFRLPGKKVLQPSDTLIEFDRFTLLYRTLLTFARGLLFQQTQGSKPWLATQTTRGCRLY